MGRKFWLYASTLMVCLTWGAIANAGGYLLPEQTARGLGRAGANIAHVADPTAMYFNPGALSKVKGFGFSGSINFPMQFSNYQRSPYTYPEAGSLDPVTVKYNEVHSKLSTLPNPALFATNDFGLKNTTFGIGLYSPSAPASHEWAQFDYNTVSQQAKDGVPRDAANAYVVEKATLVVLYPTISAAHYFENIHLGIGASLQLVYANTRVRLGLDGMTGTGANPLAKDGKGWSRSEDHPNGAMFDENPDNFVRTNVNTKGIGVTANLGVVYDPIPGLSVGVSYRPAYKVKMQGTFDFNVFNPLADALNITPEIVDNTATMDIVMPHILRAGIDYRHIENGFEVFDIELSMTYEMWSIVQKMKTTTAGPIGITTLGCIGANKETCKQRTVADVNMPFHFKNTVSLRLGGDYNGLRDRDSGQGVALRGGLFWESDGVQQKYRNAFFMPFGRVGISLGMSYYLALANKHLLSFDVGAMWIHTFKRTVTDGDFNILNPLYVCEKQVHAPGEEKDPQIVKNCKADAAAGNSPTHAVNNGTYTSNYLNVGAGISYGW